MNWDILTRTARKHDSRIIATGSVSQLYDVIHCPSIFLSMKGPTRRRALAHTGAASESSSVGLILYCFCNFLTSTCCKAVDVSDTIATAIPTVVRFRLKSSMVLQQQVSLAVRLEQGITSGRHTSTYSIPTPEVATAAHIIFQRVRRVPSSMYSRIAIVGMTSNLALCISQEYVKQIVTPYEPLL